MPMSLPRPPKVTRITVVVEREDGVTAYDAPAPSGVELEATYPAPPWDYTGWLMHVGAPRLRLDVSPNDNGYTEHVGRDAVTSLLREIADKHEVPAVDVYGDDTSWMVPILQQLITGEDVTLPKRATDYSTGVDENDPSRFWLTVWRDDGSTITQAWSVKP